MMKEDSPMRIFISSTVYDLYDLRAEVYAHLKRSKFDVMMSEIGQSDFEVKPTESSIECCLTNVRKCDIFVIIIDRRYGHQLGEYGYENKSATHLEYDEAVKNGKPILLFVRDRTDAELSIFKKFNGKEKWPGGQWVKGTEEGLFEIILQHQRLAGKTNGNWKNTFTYSTDLKLSLSSCLKVPQYNFDLSQRIEEGSIVILSSASNVIGVKGEQDPSVEFMATFRNIGRQCVFMISSGFSDYTKDWNGIIHPGDSFSATKRFPQFLSQKCKTLFYLKYCNADGLTVNEIHTAEYDYNKGFIKSSLTLNSREFTVSSPVKYQIKENV